MSKQPQGKITPFKGMTQAQLDFDIPRRFVGYTFENFTRTKDNASNLEACLSFVENFKAEESGLIMLGDVGTGKTHIGVAICHKLCERNISCHVTTITGIVREIRKTWGGVGGEDAVLDMYLKYDLLLIDEVGSQYGTDSEKIILNEIINARYEDMRPVIVIGNVSGDELKEVLGARVVDRLKHNGVVLSFTGKSLRSKK
jgi:DNA replication protein DnaC